MVPETGNPMARHPVYYSMNWKLHTRQGLKMKSELDVLVVKYEDLIGHFLPLMEAVAGYLNIPEFKPDPERGDLFDRLPENMQDNIKKKYIVLCQPQ